jgi:alkylation response protein AidB-like acyl-CoA dehydrogenase
MDDLAILGLAPQFSLTAEQEHIRDMARSFAADRIAPHALEWDANKQFPVDVIREVAALGMAGIYIREDVGGSGLKRLDAALVFEALATGSPACWTVLAPLRCAPPGCHGCVQWSFWPPIA